MKRFNLFAALAAALLITSFEVAAADECNSESAWKRVRKAYPIHAQLLAQCRDPVLGRTVIVLTEPPPHITRTKAEPIVKALFTSPVVSVERRRQPLGYDGWVEDLIIVVDTRTDTSRAALIDDFAQLAALAFGSTYKAEVESIDDLTPPSMWRAPSALEVSKEELFAWLLGKDAYKLVPVDGGAAAPLQERARRNEFGTYHSSSPGLVVALVPRSTFGPLNEYVEDLRRFFVDSDVFIGAIKVSPTHVALVGRERTTSFADAPPLRLETILLLASRRAAQLSQSYERNRAFAGKLLTNAGDLFGWDWAPILLSDAIIDTEFGSLLNFTDDMLKGWSEGGQISYKGFKHEKPNHFPFGDVGAHKTIGGDSLTYNWNTAGVGFVSSLGGVEIFAIRNTGSLPVSYFPEGSEDNENAKKRLIVAEDEAYKYFSSLRNPLLQRAVQYAALYQVFTAFDVRAARPYDSAPSSASINAVESILEKHVARSLEEVVSPNTPTNRELLLTIGFIKLGPVAQGLESLPTKPEMQIELDTFRKKFASTVLQLDREQRGDWRSTFGRLLAKGYPIPAQFKGQLDELGKMGMRVVHSPESVRQEVVRSSDRSPEGWIRTPSIVVSQGDEQRRSGVGGHNIGGIATRVEIDAAIPKGQVKVTGTYESGRVIRISPADEASEREIVRVFDREVGIRDENLAKGARSAEASLRDAPTVLRPVRVMANALELPGARPMRGASPSPKAAQVGYRADAAPVSRPEIDVVIRDTGADVVVTQAQQGFIVVRPRPAPPTTVSTPNPTSMHEAVNLAVRQVSLGPPTMLNPKVAFQNMDRSDAIRHIQTMIHHGDAVTEAGGKPPFGGSRNFFGLADGPDPNHRFDYALADRGEPLPKTEVGTKEKIWDSILSVFGKKRQRIYSSAANARAEFAIKPQWASADIRFPDVEITQVVGIPQQFGYRHVVEVSVPVTIDAAKPHSIFLRAISWFREKPSIAKTKEMNLSIAGIFKNAGKVDVQEALVRYKTMMIDQYGVDNVYMNLVREGNDIVVVELLEGSEPPLHG